MVDLGALPLTVRHDRIVPHFLAAHDEPWLALLLDEYDRFTGQPRRLLAEHFKSPPGFDAPLDKLRLARCALDQLWRAEITAAIDPRAARARVFEVAAGRPLEGDTVLAEVGAESGLSTSDLRAALFADLAGERRLAAPAERPSPTALALRANLIMVQRLLHCSTRLELRITGNARPVIRLAKLRGLICTVRRGDPPCLDISGPMSLFRRTLVYGRALAELVPQVCWCHRFCLEALVETGGAEARFQLSTGAPIMPAKAPKRFDSRVEERFARDFGRRALDWDIIREPEPVEVGPSLIFPDFILARRRPPFDRWWLEIIGFWTPDYLRQKLSRLCQAGLERLVLCVDADRDCGEQAFPEAARVIPFRRRIDVEAVLEAMDAP